jgi:tetratricopeptide (TPR) repeat protein
MTGPVASVASVQEALDRGDHDEVLRLTDALLATRPGDDAAHELRARALLALGRIDEAEQHAADAVRLDPDEIRYRELLAQVLAARGAHRDAAAEYGRLARNDPRQREWLLAEAGERLDAAQAGRAAEAARAAVRLDPADAEAQLTLATTLARLGDGAGAMAAAASAERLLPGDPRAMEAVADGRWLLGQDAIAFSSLVELAGRLDGRDAARVTAKARAIYRQHAGVGGRLLAAIPPLFDAALRRGWLHLR